MLNAYHGEWNKENAYKLLPHSVDELCALIDRLAAVRPISSYRGGASGHHAWIILSDHGFDLEVYFGEDTGKDSIVSFVLYGPYAEEEEKSIYDGRGLHGEVAIESLKVMLGLLDRGSSPIEHVRMSALEVSVVTD